MPFSLIFSKMTGITFDTWRYININVQTFNIFATLSVHACRKRSSYNPNFPVGTTTPINPLLAIASACNNAKHD
jgi:hypothetical protein